MKILATVIYVIVLAGLVFGMYALMGDTYGNGGIMTKVLIMAGVGAIYGLLRAVYRKWLVPEDSEQRDS